MIRSAWKSIVLVLGVAVGLVPVVAEPLAGSAEEGATRVTLTRRDDAGGPYGTSAYSFRHASQDLAVHKNHVDLVLNTCGVLHVALHGGQQNRVAKVTGKKLADVTAVPEEGWLTSCFQPEKDALYVIDVNDGTVRFPVKLRVLEAQPDKVTIEWAPLRRVAGGEAGTLGLCTGQHDCR